MQIPGYDLREELARGPLTSVWVAEQTSAGRIVLLKILHPQHARDPEIAKRFVREAEVIKRFDHKNIVKVYDHVSSGDITFTVMEYISGWNLRDFLNQNHPLPVTIILVILRNYLDGLGYAHEKGVIHRDIKPSNILIGTEGVVKLTDFGLAQPQDLSAITEHGNMIGTPGYTAPEILQGKASGRKSDIFSAGVTLFELLTGENPFKGETVAVTIHNIMNRQLEGVDSDRSDVPEWLVRLVTEMTARDEAERPQSVRHIIGLIDRSGQRINDTELRNFIKDRAPAAGNEYHRAAAGYPVKRRLAFAAILILVVIVSAGYFFVDRENAVSEKPAPLKELKSVPVETIGTAGSQGDKNENESVPVRPPDQFEKKTGESVSGAKLLPQPEERLMTETPARKGGLYISAVPWAYVKIDGVPQDTTPLSAPIMLEAGRHELSLENPSFEKYVDTLSISAGRIDSLNIMLSEKYGYLQVSVVPWGEIYIDKNFIETTPLKSPVRIEAGKYVLTVKNPFFKEYEQNVEVKSGETEYIVVYLE